MVMAPAQGAEGRDGARPRTLACTEDGVWLWPATPLTHRRGGALAPLPTPDLFRLVASLHGPGVHIPVLERAITTAVALLNAGRVAAANEVVAGLELPPVTYDGAALMKALGRRLGIPRPNVQVGGSPSSSRPALFDQIARIHDHKRAMAQALQGLFVPSLGRAAPANTRFDLDLHPRWPAGQSDGGRFRPRDADSPVQLVGLERPVLRIFVQILRQLLRNLARRNEPPTSGKPQEPPASGQEPPAAPSETPRVDEEPPPGIGHNRPPPDEPAPGVEDTEPPPPRPAPNVPDDEPLEIPKERPDEKQAESVWGRRVSDAMRRALEKGDLKTAADLARQLAEAPWLEGQIENILADQDPPSELDELVDRARPGPLPGYNRHHIVEQGRQNDDLSQEQLQSPENIVLVPTYKHWQITNYYQTRQDQLGGLSPREFLRGKTFQERYEYGLKVLRMFGVLR